MIDCKKLAQDIKDECKEKLKDINKSYYLKIIQVDGDVASDVYTNGKRKDCEEIGLECYHVLLPKDCHVLDVAHEIANGNHDPYCVGIILQLPLPKHLERFKDRLIKLIEDTKDVDGFIKESPYKPCTPAGIIHILQSVMPDVSGKHCVVIGRSQIVGYPTFEMLNELNATVTLCNSHTPKHLLNKFCSSADVIVCATGVPNLITPSMVYSNTVVIDAGISRGSDGKLCGDCSKDLYKFMKHITPVPNGVGLITRAMLMKNCTDAVLAKERLKWS